MISVHVRQVNEELRNVTLCNDVIACQPTETVGPGKRASKHCLCAARELLDGVLCYLLELVAGHGSLCGITIVERTDHSLIR